MARGQENPVHELEAFKSNSPQGKREKETKKRDKEKKKKRKEERKRKEKKRKEEKGVQYADDGPHCLEPGGRWFYIHMSLGTVIGQGLHVGIYTHCMYVCMYVQ